MGAYHIAILRRAQRFFMRIYLHRRSWILSLALLVTVVLGLFLAHGSESRSPHGSLPAPGFLLFMALLGGGAALHRPLGGRHLGLGALVLPPVIVSQGVFAATLVGVVAFVLAETGSRLLGGTSRDHGSSSLRPHQEYMEAFNATCRATLTVLAGGWVWTALPAKYHHVTDTLTRGGAGSGGTSDLVSDLAVGGALGGAGYLVSAAVLSLLAERARRPVQNQDWRLLLPLGVDAVGWGLGVPLMTTGLYTGWSVAGTLLVAIVLLALEAARNASHRLRLEGQVENLQRLRRADQRIIQSSPEQVSLAEQIRVECANVIPFSWFHFELLAGDQPGTWRAGPHGPVEAGQPEPGKTPPPLPGIHRRSSWRLIDRHLKVEGQPMARLRLWCDPRRLDEQSMELLDMLIPQMAVSVERSILDRQAKRDTLTGLAVRRVLEGQLQEAYDRSYEEGSSVAVILCDLDHFKKINDTYGHTAGDQALVHVARILERCGRKSDICSRHGGEEFAVLLRDTDGATALAVAERVRREVERCRVLYEGEELPVSLSAGVAAFPELYIRTATELLLLADSALYVAKGSGRNRCLLHLGRRRFRDPTGQLVLVDAQFSLTRKAKVPAGSAIPY